MTGGIQNIGRIPELQKRILFTLGMLAVYRVGAKIVTPGINPEVIQQFFQQQVSGTVFALFNVFSGGALEQLSIFALGIMPYISASIIMQLLTIVLPPLDGELSAHLVRLLGRRIPYLRDGAALDAHEFASRAREIVFGHAQRLLARDAAIELALQVTVYASLPGRHAPSA